MAGKHILSLDIPQSSNCEILPIVDTSDYNEDLGVDCPELLITSPGYNSPRLIKTTVVKDSDGNWETFGRLNLTA